MNGRRHRRIIRVDPSAFCVRSDPSDVFLLGYLFQRKGLPDLIPEFPVRLSRELPSKFPLGPAVFGTL